MRKTIACLLVLALSSIGCTTVMNVRGIGGFHSPNQGDNIEFGIKIGSSSGVDKDVISVDRSVDLPEQSSPEDIVQDEMPIPQTLAIGLIIGFIVRDTIDSIQISMGNII